MIVFLPLLRVWCTEQHDLLEIASHPPGVFDLELLHPGYSRVEKQKAEIHVILSAPDGGDLFYMDVKSVFCLTGLCKIVNVRLFWNELGDYQSLEVLNGDHLEKAGGVPFSPEDYQKLDSLLADADTRIWDLDLKTIGMIQSDQGTVDVVSSATISIESSRYVAGAAWTCYTLWHWVHSGVSEFIRARTSEKYEHHKLLSFLNEENLDYQEFALESLSRRSVYDPESVEVVKKLDFRNNPRLLDGVLTYAIAAPSEIFFDVIFSIYSNSDKIASIKCLNSISNNETPPTADFLCKIMDIAASRSSYPEIHQIFKIIEDKKVRLNPVLRDLMFKLLDDESVFIARRSYWFLRGQDLSRQEISLLDAFRDAHEEIL